MKLTVNQILYKGVAAHKKGKFKEAENLYRAILETEPKHPDANHNLGIILNSLSKSASALSLFKTAIDANPNIEQFWISYINALVNEKRFEEAEFNFRKVTTSNPNFAIIQNNLSAMLYKLGRLQESEVNARKAIELKPDFVEAYNNLGNVLHDLNKIDEAETNYKKAIELNPDYAEAYYNLGTTLNDLNRIDEAEENYKKAIELKPKYVEAYYNLGRTLYNIGKLEEAKVNYKKAIELRPDYAEAYNNLGIVLNDLGKLGEAEEKYKKSIEFNPNNAEAYNNLGTNLNDLGKLDEAETNYKKALEIRSTYTEAFNNLQVVLTQKKLLLNIRQANKTNNINKAKLSNINKSEFNTRLGANLFITNRKEERELLTDIYKNNTKKLDDVDLVHLRYGNGRSSDYELFQNNSLIIKKVAKDLTNIMKQAVNSDIFIMESFFIFFQGGSGITSHRHLTRFDKVYGLANQKYSLTYYLSIGDQNCNEPGFLKLYDPEEEILPSKGTIAIFSAGRKHGAIYGGKIDRVMMGVNFYSLI